MDTVFGTELDASLGVDLSIEAELDIEVDVEVLSVGLLNMKFFAVVLGMECDGVLGFEARVLEVE